MARVSGGGDDGTEPRPYTEETGKGRLDKDGVEWFACDPYPTWYRRVGKRLITRSVPEWADN